MARYQVILAYDGSGFTGSQRQANSRTVQGELENALRKLGWSESRSLWLAEQIQEFMQQGRWPHSISTNGRTRAEKLVAGAQCEIPA
jgi:tRNA pseudouridine(38-40) synthase